MFYILMFYIIMSWCSIFYVLMESAKLRALRAKIVLPCQRVLRAYLLTCQRALRAYVLMC